MWSGIEEHANIHALQNHLESCISDTCSTERWAAQIVLFKMLGSNLPVCGSVVTGRNISGQRGKI